MVENKKEVRSMRLVIANAFSVNMLDRYAKLFFNQVSVEEAKREVQEAAREGRLYSIVGHEGTAKLLSKLFEVEIPVNRENFKLTNDDDLLLVAVIPFRLAEGQVLSEEQIKQLSFWYVGYSTT